MIRVLSILLLVTAGLAAYANSFSVPFLFDDQRHIVLNPNIRHPWHALAETTRPVVDLSLALNYAVGGLRPIGYHVVNLAIHLFAALLLFGIVRRTLQGPRLHDRFGQSASQVALVTALLWTLHPIQTQSVTYIIQRAESLAGMFALLTLSMTIRSVSSTRPQWWHAAAVASCVLGMGSKPVMATVPLVVLLYDRVFLSSSWAEPLRRRGWLYLGLSATWGLLAWLLLTRFDFVRPDAGFTLAVVSPLEYARTQPQVSLHYLRLALWPHPLVFDYLWPVARTAETVVLPTALLSLLAAGTAWALRDQPPVGFLGAWWFLTLAPTSSIIPIADLAAEHRVYLPLVAVIAFFVCGVHRLLGRLLPTRAPLRRRLATAFAVTAVVALGILTHQRNRVYQHERTVWEDVLAKRPNHFRAHSSLGRALVGEGRLEEAITHFTEALRLVPDHPQTHYNLGYALIQTRRFEEAIAHCAEALRLHPPYPEAHNGRGIALRHLGRLDEAIAEFVAALRLNPDYADAYYNLGNVFFQQGKLDAAAVHYLESIRLQPPYAQYAEAHNGLGNVLLQQGKVDDAIAHFTEALRRRPDYAEAHNNLANLLAEQGRLDEALLHYREALRLAPTNVAVHINLANALAQQGRFDEAIAHYQAALQLRPGDPVATRNLELTLTRQHQQGL